jgi:hypothetical protein
VVVVAELVLLLLETLEELLQIIHLATVEQELLMLLLEPFYTGVAVAVVESITTALQQHQDLAASAAVAVEEIAVQA